MATTPEQRNERLLRHALSGWTRARQDVSARRRAGGWITAHPSPMAEVDALWHAALEGEGPLAAWLSAGAEVATWNIPIALHSLLACHPFPDLPHLHGDCEASRVLADAARLIEAGEIVVFGSAALAFWMKAPPRGKVVDVWCVPADRADAITAVMGELSWYHDQHSIFIEVWAPETFAAPDDWRTRSKRLQFIGSQVSIVLPHPHDVMMARLERMEVKGRDHVRAIVAEFPLGEEQLERLVQGMPHRRGAVAQDRIARFEAGLAELRVLRTLG